MVFSVVGVGGVIGPSLAVDLGLEVVDVVVDIVGLRVVGLGVVGLGIVGLGVVGLGVVGLGVIGLGVVDET